MIRTILHDPEGLRAAFLEQPSDHLKNDIMEAVASWARKNVTKNTSIPVESYEKVLMLRLHLVG